MAYKIICYGDSNTYGACGFVGGRHHADIRWTGILQNSGLYDVVNLGENGREIPSDQWELNDLSGAWGLLCGYCRETSSSFC